jgi:DNA-binding GntR family transcriptional regulator
MGLSQIPIRAAIQRLQAEGLIIINPHASAIVAPLLPEKIDEVFALLESLERAAFRFAAQNHTDADLDVLTNLVRHMDIAIAEPNSADWLTLNSAFHRKIAAISAMPLLTTLPIDPR